jgi:Arc/MetJ family transcription regulator
MRINIEIDDRLMRRAMKARAARTKRATVEAALKLLVDTRAQGSICRLRGKVHREGNFEESRLGRAVDQPY